LRERGGDIGLLAHHFLQRWAQELKKEVRGFTPEALQRLLMYEWPGNVRELSNVVERAVVLATTSMITAEGIVLGRPDTAVAVSSGLTTLREAREKFERKYLIQVLTTVKGNVSRAAELAGKDRAEFYRLLRKHTLLPTAFKGEHAAHQE
jgi:two-component system response regulator GlrR